MEIFSLIVDNNEKGWYEMSLNENVNHFQLIHF